VGRPDFVYSKERVVIELQSYRHHGDREAWEKDQARFGDFSALDWMLITVTYLQLKLEPQRVVERIRRVLQVRARLAAG
jgi:very-short-patch-repair endonuclease